MDKVRIRVWAMVRVRERIIITSRVWTVVSLIPILVFAIILVVCVDKWLSAGCSVVVIVGEYFLAELLVV